MSKTRRAQEITVPQECKKDEKKKPAAEMMRGGHGSAMSDGALNNNDNFRSTQKLRRHDCEDGSAENQVDSASGGCRRESLPRIGGGFHARTLSAN